MMILEVFFILLSVWRCSDIPTDEILGAKLNSDFKKMLKTIKMMGKEEPLRDSILPSILFADDYNLSIVQYLDKLSDYAKTGYIQPLSIYKNMWLLEKTPSAIVEWNSEYPSKHIEYLGKIRMNSALLNSMFKLSAITERIGFVSLSNAISRFFTKIFKVCLRNISNDTESAIYLIQLIMHRFQSLTKCIPRSLSMSLLLTFIPEALNISLNNPELLQQVLMLYRLFISNRHFFPEISSVNLLDGLINISFEAQNPELTSSIISILRCYIRECAYSKNHITFVELLCVRSLYQLTKSAIQTLDHNTISPFKSITDNMWLLDVMYGNEYTYGVINNLYLIPCANAFSIASGFLHKMWQCGMNDSEQLLRESLLSKLIIDQLKTPVTSNCMDMNVELWKRILKTDLIDGKYLSGFEKELNIKYGGLHTSAFISTLLICTKVAESKCIGELMELLNVIHRWIYDCVEMQQRINLDLNMTLILRRMMFRAIQLKNPEVLKQGIKHVFVHVSKYLDDLSDDCPNTTEDGLFLVVTSLRNVYDYIDINPVSINWSMLKLRSQASSLQVFNAVARIVRMKEKKARKVLNSHVRDIALTIMRATKVIMKIIDVDEDELCEADVSIKILEAAEYLFGVPGHDYREISDSIGPADIPYIMATYIDYQAVASNFINQ